MSEPLVSPPGRTSLKIDSEGGSARLYNPRNGLPVAMGELVHVRESRIVVGGQIEFSMRFRGQLTPYGLTLRFPDHDEEEP